jgi:hypothetical protein
MNVKKKPSAFLLRPSTPGLVIALNCLRQCNKKYKTCQVLFKIRSFFLRLQVISGGFEWFETITIKLKF